MQKYYEEEEIRRAIRVLHDPSGTFEIRAIGTAKKDIISGYFRDADNLLLALKKIDFRSRNLYITLSEIKEECFARAQSNRFLKAPQTTSDTEVVSYRWLFIDLDPVRTAGISSSNTELEYSRKLAHKVLDYMNGLGFPEPVIAMSGNGYHLLFRIDVPNDKDGRMLVDKCLKVLASLFDTEEVKIDTTNSNPSRICKLYGTLAQKGSDTAERPHRMSGIISVPEVIRITTSAVLKSLADELPDIVPQQRPAGRPAAQEFDLLEFMSDHGMTYKEDFNDRARIFRLDHCPFDHNHVDGDAKVFLYDNGAIAFKCHHNSCKRYKWQDVRLLYEPDAYDQKEDDGKRFDEGWKQHVATRAQLKPKEPEKPKKKKIRKLKTAKSLMAKDLPEPVTFVGVGDDLPLLMEGTCILSAKPKLGKSWLALSMCLAISNGEEFLGYKTRRCSTLYLDLETSEQLQQKRLKKALNGRPVPDNFYLDTETDNMENGFLEQIEAYLREDPSIGVVVIDVFQIIRSKAKSMKESEYEHAYRDITPLNDFAQKHQISIILVCHDRKAVDPDDPFSNILGSTGLQGAATQMMVMFRRKKTDPIHISVKGKTIDGLPELDVKLENAQWSLTGPPGSHDQEKAEALHEFKSSEIRTAVLTIAEKLSAWRGRCSELIDIALDLGVVIEDGPKYVGGFLRRHRVHFQTEDSVEVKPVKNGTGGSEYIIRKTTVDTVDENKGLTVDGWENLDKSRVPEIPFL